MITIMEYHSPVGVLILGEYKRKICISDWKYRTQRDRVDSRIQKYTGAIFKRGENKILDFFASELDAYFDKTLTNFKSPVLFCGTDFQISVWEELQSIPYGKTSTYLELSKKLGNELAIRAVASANGANALSIIVPCHRIIGSDGALVGYAGGIEVKKNLLQLEGVNIGGQLDMFN